MVRASLAAFVVLAAAIGEYLDSVKCINKAGPGVKTCIQDFLVAMHRAATAPANKQVAYTCCYYLDFVGCLEKKLTSSCNLPTAIKFFNLVIEKIVGESLDVACGKYKKGPNTCQALPALSTKNDNNARGKGFVEPLVILAGNLG
ncbi:hypothetical protein HPB48_018966 [Haemaphysalis longicornis]|uniref:Uncharacterized protein n=1 Tax=Haemaphysalis longicornis TaxID=44386 RepID=A0A9J6GAB0_HAELO|nr:hypothetical protein HPB48_018966 [Haemaphysalis longicornis]